MHSFTSVNEDDQFYITGRGFAFTFPASCIPEDMYDPGVLTGKYVKINDKLFRVTGVEMFRNRVFTPERPYRQSFGLLTRSTNEVSDALLLDE
jgi:hypothetical protein